MLKNGVLGRADGGSDIKELTLFYDYQDFNPRSHGGSDSKSHQI